jgi:hypothetical protein
MKAGRRPQKIFDSGRQRVADTDISYNKTIETKKIQIYAEKPKDSAPKNNWREKHNNFISSLRNARDINKAQKNGDPLPKFQYSAIPSDYVMCEFCSRNFSKNAAERHKPFCETQAKRSKMANAMNNQKNNQRGALSSSGKVGLGARKPSSDAIGYSSAGSRPPNQGYSSGPASRGFASGNERKPIKYESKFYSDNDEQDNPRNNRNQVNF